MKKWSYYNDNDPFACEWLTRLIDAGELPAGLVDNRSIKEVQPDDLAEFRQVHVFCGVGGWPLAARIANFPEDRELWTGSCPCQPFSNAGQGGGTDDPRHLWPDFFRLIRARRPALVMGEQVASALGRAWFDGVGADLEGENYACRAVDIPACAVDAPHIRSRLYWIATRTSDLGDTPGATSERRAGRFPAPEAGEHRAGQLNGGSPVGPGDADEGVGDTHGARANIYASPRPSRRATGEPDDGVGLADAGCFAGRAGPGQSRDGFWSDHEWLVCHDGKARRTVPGLPLLVDGVSGRVALGDALPGRVSEDEAYHMISRVGAWRGFGNAIVPQLAAEVIGAFLDAEADEQDFFA